MNAASNETALGAPHRLVTLRIFSAGSRRLVERFEWHYTPKHGSWLDMAESDLLFSHHNVSTGASPPSKSSSTKSPHGRLTAMPITPKPTGSSQPRTPASNSRIYTRLFKYLRPGPLEDQFDVCLWRNSDPPENTREFRSPGRADQICSPRVLLTITHRTNLKLGHCLGYEVGDNNPL